MTVKSLGYGLFSVYEIVDAMTEYEAKLRELDVLKKKRSVMQ